MSILFILYFLCPSQSSVSFYLPNHYYYRVLHSALITPFSRVIQQAVFPWCHALFLVSPFFVFILYSRLCHSIFLVPSFSVHLFPILCSIIPYYLCFVPSFSILFIILHSLFHHSPFIISYSLFFVPSFPLLYSLLHHSLFPVPPVIPSLGMAATPH